MGELTDPLAKYVTDYPNKDVAAKVTIHQLLTHTGGTGDIFGPDFDAHRLELRTLDDYVMQYGARGLKFEPGGRWEYMSHKLLNAEYTNMLVTGKADVGNGEMYAYGFEDGRKNGDGAVGHGGGAPGMNGELRIYPKSGYVIAVLANLDPPAASQVNGFIDPRLPR